MDNEISGSTAIINRRRVMKRILDKYWKCPHFSGENRRIGFPCFATAKAGTEKEGHG